MRCEYVYDIISNLEEVCSIAHSMAYHINWSTGYLSTSNSFILFIAPVFFEHDFKLVKFTDKEDNYDD